MMERIGIFAGAMLALMIPIGANAATPASASQQLIGKLQWRSIGPYIGGRSVAVAGG